jgi:tripartite-type tricarboxylate transporter receptor subunit TctC
VHYKGAAPATMDMIGGVVDTNVEALTSALPNLQAGKYRALAVLSDKRQPGLPDVPTFQELGWPNVVGETWYAVSAPAGTPRPVLDRLGATLGQVVASPEFAQAMQRTGNVPLPGSPEAMRKMAQAESAKWGALIRRLNLRLD